MTFGDCAIFSLVRTILENWSKNWGGGL